MQLRSRRGRVFSQLRASDSVGLVLGPVLGGLVAWAVTIARLQREAGLVLGGGNVATRKRHAREQIVREAWLALGRELGVPLRVVEVIDLEVHRRDQQSEMRRRW